MISVVIPARDAAAELPATLAALAGLDVIVVANASRDDTAAVARAHGARVAELDRPHRAAARNRGAEMATGEILLFTDAGCVPRPGWADALTRCLERAPLAGGPVEIETSAEPNAPERFDALWRFKQEHAVTVGGWTAGANLGIRRDAFERVGGFDERYEQGEDVDLCIRVKDIAWCPDAVVAHPASTSMRLVLRRALRQGFANTRLRQRLGPHVGRSDHWRHPGGIVRGHAALRALLVDPDLLDPGEARRMAMVARLDYAARYAGSAWAALTRARS